MSSSSREPVAAVCWNCDRQADDVASVSLRARLGAQVAVALCHDCHATTYLPLTAGAPELLAGGGHNKAVLVVDDDPDILDMLRHALRGNGYAVETAANGLEALHRACRRLPDAVVLDLRMPTMDGRTFIAAWRRVTAGAPVPVVAISAQSRQPTAEELGVEAFLPKPFDLGVLVGTVDRLLATAA